MNPELAEYLNIIEMKLNGLIQDIKNIRSRLSEPENPTRASGRPSFFDALKSDDDANIVGVRP